MEDNTTINNQILDIPASTHYWFVRSGSKAEYYDDFGYNNYVAIGDNNVTLSSLLSIEKKYRATDDILMERYKKVFKDVFLKEYKESSKNKDKNADEKQKDLITLTRSASIAALKTYRFVEKMRVGDIVIVPASGSSSFRVGVITTDVFSEDVKHVFIPSEEDQTQSAYVTSLYDKKRRVAWIKEITERELPDKLLWIKSGHQAIFDITANAEAINPLISSLYFYKNEFHARIGVGTPNPISSSQWYHLQKVIVEAAPKIADSVYQKHKVESIGQIIIQGAQEHWDDILFICTILFGRAGASIKGKTYHINGILTNFYPSVREQHRHEKAMNDHEETKAELEETALRLDNDRKQLENEKLKSEQKKADESVKAPSVIPKDLADHALMNQKTEVAEVNDVNVDYTLNETQKNVLSKLNLSDDEVGDAIPAEMQVDSLNEAAEEHEKKE